MKNWLLENNPEASDIRERVAARLARALSPEASVPRHLLEPPAPDLPLTPAAVLVPLVNQRDGVTVLLTRRTEHLNDHAGQVSFPGGRAEADDPSLIHTAIREAEEEIGLSPGAVEVLGRLPDYQTGTGFRVAPIVAWVEPPFAVTPDPFEVAEVFEVPLIFFLDPANHQRHRREIRGETREFFAMPYGEHYIWGATAGMLFNLYWVLSLQEAPD